MLERGYWPKQVDGNCVTVSQHCVDTLWWYQCPYLKGHIGTLVVYWLLFLLVHIQWTIITCLHNRFYFPKHIIKEDAIFPFRIGQGAPPCLCKPYCCAVLPAKQLYCPWEWSHCLSLLAQEGPVWTCRPLVHLPWVSMFVWISHNFCILHSIGSLLLWRASRFRSSLESFLCDFPCMFI